MTKVLLTGGSGFIAAHILEKLLARGYEVVTTVRSEDKAEKIRAAHKDSADALSVVIVPDISQEGAFDEVAKTPGLDVVLHTASPFHFNIKDVDELINPALIGTTSILKAIHRSAPSVKHVVVTSSFAAILDAAHLEDATVYSEASWNPNTREDAKIAPSIAYRVSKTLAERAAWDFVAKEKPNFTLSTINPPMVFGPVVHHLASLDTVNTSNSRIVDALSGKWKEGIPLTTGAYIWIDVRDVAEAHIRAFEKSAAHGQRLFVTEGYFSNKEIADIIRKNFPEYADRLPSPDAEGGGLLPKSQLYVVNDKVTRGILGIEYATLEKSMVDLVKSIKSFGI